jgi:hypothetical protein
LETTRVTPLELITFTILNLDNLDEARDIMGQKENLWVPTSINYDFESTNDVRLTIEVSQNIVEEVSPPKKPYDEQKSIDEDSGVFDEFSEFERNSINNAGIKNKIDLNYTTANLRTSLIPKVKYQNIIMKKNIMNCHLSHFDRLVMKNVKTSDPYNVTEVLLKEVARINTQIISAKNKLYKLIWLWYEIHLEQK